MQEWFILYQMEPWGEKRLDILIASIQATLASIYRKKGSSPPKISDFIIDWWSDVKRARGRAAFDSFKAATAHLAKRKED